MEPLKESPRSEKQVIQDPWSEVPTILTKHDYLFSGSFLSVGVELLRPFIKQIRGKPMANRTEGEM